MNRAVDLNVPEFVRADIKVDSIDGCVVASTPGHAATASATAFNFPVSAGGGSIRLLVLAR